MIKAIPLILDTDIGSDIDDTWALAMVLKSPELDLKLVTVNEYDTVYKAKLTCKMLQIAGREDIPVGIGRVGEESYNNIHQWVDDYDLSSYPNVKENAADAIIDCVMSSDEKVTILAIGSFKNLAEAYAKEPRIAKKSRIVVIAGNVFNNAFGGWHPPLGSEWNIRCDLEAWKNGVERTDWETLMVPLDVSGGIKLANGYYEKIKEYGKTDPVIGAMVESYEIWVENMKWDTTHETSALFDTVGVYCLLTRENIRYEMLPIYTNDASITLVDPERGKMMEVATKWHDKEKFYKFLTARLCGEI